MSEEKGKRDDWQKSMCVCFKELPLLILLVEIGAEVKIGFV